MSEKDGVVTINKDEDLFVLIDSLSSEPSVQKEEKSDDITASTIRRVEQEIEAIQQNDEVEAIYNNMLQQLQEATLRSVEDEKSKNNTTFVRQFEISIPDSTKDPLANSKVGLDFCDTNVEDFMFVERREDITSPVSPSPFQHSGEKRIDVSLEEQPVDHSKRVKHNAGTGGNDSFVLDAMERGDFAERVCMTLNQVRSAKSDADDEDSDSDSEGVIEVLGREFEEIAKNVVGFFKKTCSSTSAEEIDMVEKKNK